MNPNERIPNISELKFIRNQYTRVRGEPRFYKIFCSFCNKLILIYQKDGPGRLLRCYRDRIHYPADIDPYHILKCRHCQNIIGCPMIYKPERREAFRMNRDKYYFDKI